LLQAMIVGVKAIEFSGSVAYREEKTRAKAYKYLCHRISIALALIVAIALFNFCPADSDICREYLRRGREEFSFSSTWLTE